MITGLTSLPIENTSVPALEELMIYLDESQYLTSTEILNNQIVQFIELFKHATYHSD